MEKPTNIFRFQFLQFRKNGLYNFYKIKIIFELNYI